MFELEYWGGALGTAQRWRERLGMPRDRRWGRSGPPFAASSKGWPLPRSRRTPRRRSPGGIATILTMLGTLGVLPGARVDRETMRRTLRKVMSVWK
jgi:hypothetical protein